MVAVPVVEEASVEVVEVAEVEEAVEVEEAAGNDAISGDQDT
jgi:hypothetical protein